MLSLEYTSYDFPFRWKRHFPAQQAANWILLSFTFTRSGGAISGPVPYARIAHTPRSTRDTRMTRQIDLSIKSAFNNKVGMHKMQLSSCTWCLNSMGDSTSRHKPGMKCAIIKYTQCALGTMAIDGMVHAI